MRIAIIGGGIGGLGAAALLAKAGHTVTVYEKNEVLGGRAGVFEANGFTFDMGPSWYLMPDVFEAFFHSLESDIHSLLDLVRLDPQYRVFFEGLPVPVDVPADFEGAVAVAESLEPGSGPAFRKYIEVVGRQYRLVVDQYLTRDVSQLHTLADRYALEALTTLPLTGSIDAYVSKYFKNPRLKQLLEYTLVFLGASPYKAPALYAMMAHVDFGLGVYYPQGGINKLIEALVTMGTEFGVTFKTNSAVTSIQTIDGKAMGLLLKDGSVVPADVVVSNADMHHTETALLSKELQTYPEEYWQTRTMAPSAVLLYLGVQGELPMLQHHNLYFAEQWKEHFDSIYDTPKWPKNPSFYLSNPSKTDPSVAPVGSENLFALFPIASGFGTSEEVEEFAERAIDMIAERMDIPGLRGRITYRRVFGPDDFTTRYHSFQGTALGLSHTLKQTAFMRPQNQSKYVSNLYYVGAGVHPGIGMPVCLISASLVAEKIRKQSNKR